MTLVLRKEMMEVDQEQVGATQHKMVATMNVIWSVRIKLKKKTFSKWV
jgi:hypothetical protein